VAVVLAKSAAVLAAEMAKQVQSLALALFDPAVAVAVVETMFRKQQAMVAVAAAEEAAVTLRVRLELLEHISLAAVAAVAAAVAAHFLAGTQGVLAL
jgi:methionine synthase I (cobalamin-dependent)